METIMYIFLIAAFGYLTGRIKVKGLSLGTSGVLLIALVFGHFGVEIPSVVRNFGLAVFVGSVGLIAGPVFFRNFKKKVYAYLITGILITLLGAAVTIVAGKLANIPFDLAIGMFTGAMTSTPGLAAATEATEAILGAGKSLASIGYGIAYLFGVVGVVLYVQIYPQLMKTDLEQEAVKLHERLHDIQAETKIATQNYKVLESSGFMVLSVSLALGLLLGSVEIPLPGGMSFSLGTAGGPLFVGLCVGHFHHVGGFAIRVPEITLKVMRELGLCLFLLGAGTQAGAGFVQVLKEYGWMLFGVGVLITLIPMVMACLLSVFLLKLDTLSTLGAVCGGMTSTPALGALISSVKTEDVAASYAATYPFALICMVLFSQILAIIW